MKIEKAETINIEYPKLKEISKKEYKRKIGIIAALAITLKSKYVAATTTPGMISMDEIIPGDLVVELKPEFIASKYTGLGYNVMIIVSVISLIIIKLKWKKYNLRQKKIAKIILGILLAVTVILIIITMILKLKA